MIARSDRIAVVTALVRFVRRNRFQRPLSSGAYVGFGSFAHCRIFESGRSAAILHTPLVEILH
jgi:hypothetical protein